mgnify:CR=1 FL=1
MDIITAHKFCSNNRESILKSKECGCFYCLELFSPKEIVFWRSYKDGVGESALCPRCRINSVIGDADLKFDISFLESMQKYWFLE